LRKVGGRWQVLEARLGTRENGEPRDMVSWLGLTPAEMAQGDATRVLERAALLHTDIATLLETRLLAPAGPSPQGRRTASVTVNDGRFESYEVDSEHWDFARAVLDHVRPSPSDVPAVRDWYRAVAAYQVSQLNYGELGRHLQHARTVLPGDAVLAMMAGVRHQAFASSRVQASLATVALPPGMTLSVGSRDRELIDARQAYRDALKLDPGLVEARIRLGRVLADEGKPAEAAGELRAALAVAGEPMLQYLAALFLGEQEAALGRAEDAAAAYERARSLYPTAPSPHLALSQLARARGDRATALETLDRAMRLAASRTVDDPWWSFIASAGRMSDEWMAQVRLAFAGEPPP
jgi:tetratricopeptide (TPR) repeat protein